MKLRAAIYARVSTSEQTKGYSLGSQIKGCQEYADRYDFEVVSIIQEDVSGATRLEERGGGSKLLDLANNGVIDVIIVWRLDRLSRPPEDELSRLQTTVEYFARKGVEVHDCESGAVRNGDMAAMMVAFFKGIVASQERAATRERTIRGRINKAKSGRWVGNGYASFGYRKLRSGREERLEIDPEKAAVVVRIFNMYLGQNGEERVPSLRSLARRLTSEGIPSCGGRKWYAATIQRMMSERTYLGEFTYSDIVIKLPELAIIDEMTWQAAQAQLKKNRVQAKRNRKRDYLVVNRIRCICGGRMGGTTVSAQDKEYRYYACFRQNAYGHIAQCNERMLRADVVDALVWQKICDLIGDEEAVREGFQEMRRQAEKEFEPVSERLALIEDMIEKSEKKIRRLVEAFGDEENSTIAEALRNQARELAAVKESQERERDALRLKLAQNEITQEFEDGVVLLTSTIKAQLGIAAYEDKRALLDLLDAEIQLRRTGEERSLDLVLAIAPDKLPIAYDAS